MRRINSIKIIDFSTCYYVEKSNDFQEKLIKLQIQLQQFDNDIELNDYMTNNFEVITVDEYIIQ